MSKFRSSAWLTVSAPQILVAAAATSAAVSIIIPASPAV